MDGKWQVLAQRETIAPSKLGTGFEKVIDITFRTAAGNVGNVSVPKDSYNVDTARAAIDAHAEQLDAVTFL